MLVPVVGSHVRISGPDQHGIDPAVSFLQIIEVPIHGIATGNRIVKIPILHHHLRLEETRLRPLEYGQVVARAVIADADATFVTPVTDVGQPGIVLVPATSLGSALPRPFHDEAVGRWNLLTIRAKV